ncbi:MAG TPA: SDR family oxidoreductase [Erysipelothrix sp.]
MHNKVLNRKGIEMEMKSQKPKKDYLQDDLTINTEPRPIVEDAQYQASDKLKGKNVFIVGGDSGIGQAVALLFAKEGANIYFSYYKNEREDAMETAMKIEALGGFVKAFEMDVKDSEALQYIKTTIKNLDILIYNAAEQHYQKDFRDIELSQLQRVFETNIFAALAHVQTLYDIMNEDGNIIFTTSVTAFKGNPELMDYAASKGALTSLMRSLSQSEVIKEKNIRVNAVAPGPVWTPLIPATIPNYDENWGESGPYETHCQPIDVAYSFLFLAQDESRYITGQTIHVNGLETT